MTKYAITIFFSVFIFQTTSWAKSASIKAQPSFLQLYNKSDQLSQNNQKKFFKILTSSQIKMELRSQVSQRNFIFEILLPSLWAEENYICVNNGFVASVQQCDRSTRWSFDVTSSPSFQPLRDAGFGISCSSGEQPCALVSGISASGDLVCANNSTKTCAERGDLGVLIKLKADCKNKESVVLGSRTISCGKMNEHYQQQMKEFDDNCHKAVNAVKSLCYETRQKLKNLYNETEDSSSSLTQNPENNNVLVLGDSHLSCTNYAKNLHSCLKNANFETTLLARGSAAPSHWRTGSRKGLQRLCGYNSSGQKVGPGSMYNSWNAGEAIKKQKAGTLILNLGDNLLYCAKRKNDQCIKKQFNDLMRSAKTANPNLKCIFVTPTLPTKAGGGSYGKTLAHAYFLRTHIMLAAQEHNCSVIDGIKETGHRSNGRNLSGGDGVHLSSKDSGILGNRVCQKALGIIKTSGTVAEGDAPTVDN